jgi:hypothetical protein
MSKKKKRWWLLLAILGMIATHLGAMAAGTNRAKALCQLACGGVEGEVTPDGQQVVVRIPEADIPVLEIKCEDTDPVVCPVITKEMIKEAFDDWLLESCDCEVCETCEPCEDVPVEDVLLSDTVPLAAKWQWGVGGGLRMDRDEPGAILLADWGRDRWRVFGAVTWTDWDEQEDLTETLSGGCSWDYYDCPDTVVTHSQRVTSDDTSVFIGLKYDLNR